MEYVHVLIHTLVHAFMSFTYIIVHIWRIHLNTPQHSASCILTAYPLTTAITGFFILVTISQWPRKLPPNTCWNVFPCISLISAPAANTTMKRTTWDFSQMKCIISNASSLLVVHFRKNRAIFCVWTAADDIQFDTWYHSFHRYHWNQKICTWTVAYRAAVECFKMYSNNYKYLDISWTRIQKCIQNN